MGRVLPVLRAFSLILGMFAATMLVPLAVSWLLGDGAAFAYDEAFLTTGAAVAMLWLLSRRCTRELQIKDGFLLVVLTWTSLPAFAYPMKESKLTPRMAHTAKGLWLIYAGISLACLLAMRWAGMEWGDALIHTFTTMGLGGFSNHDASFAYFGSVRIELVTILFMTLAGMNFSTHFLAWRGRGLAPYRHDPEILWFLVVRYGSVLVFAWYLWRNGTYGDFPDALRFSAFNVVASFNNTGPGLNEVKPAGNYAVLSDFQTWVCTFAMLLGRLEIFTLLVVLTPTFWIQ